MGREIISTAWGSHVSSYCNQFPGRFGERKEEKLEEKLTGIPKDEWPRSFVLPQYQALLLPSTSPYVHDMYQLLENQD